MRIFFKLIIVLVLIFSLTNSAFYQLPGDIMRQTGSLKREKECRTPVQKKTDSQLLYAMKNGSGETITALVSPLQVNINKHAGGFVSVDNKVSNITKTSLTTILNAGGEIIFQS